MSGNRIKNTSSRFTASRQERCALDRANIAVWEDEGGALGHYTRVSVPVRRIARAGGGLEPLFVNDRQVAADVADQAARLERTGGLRNASAAHSEHAGEKFVRDMKTA